MKQKLLYRHLHAIDSSKDLTQFIHAQAIFQIDGIYRRYNFRATVRPNSEKNKIIELQLIQVNKKSVMPKIIFHNVIIKICPNCHKLLKGKRYARKKYCSFKCRKETALNRLKEKKYEEDYHYEDFEL